MPFCAGLGPQRSPILQVSKGHSPLRQAHARRHHGSDVASSALPRSLIRPPGGERRGGRAANVTVGGSAVVRILVGFKGARRPAGFRP